VFFDLKVMDPLAHRRWTGQDNAPILRNLALLADLRRPFVARVPLVPGVTDTNENLTAIAAAVASQPTLVRVELLPYNRAAGGKYAACGRTFLPGFDEDRQLNVEVRPFRNAGIEVRVS
ncbi:MAG: glycyl-radical enzyme activating protein, partial [Candidatus Limnocylindrales bacterium]